MRKGTDATNCRLLSGATGRPAVGLDPDSRIVTLADGTRLPYDGLLIATGAAARSGVIPGEPGPGQGVFTLRGRDDATALRAALTPGSTVGRLPAAAFAGPARLVGSPETLQEVAWVLARPKFAARLPHPIVESFIARLIAQTWVVEADDAVAECRDPADDIVLEMTSCSKRLRPRRERWATRRRS